jgi:membrane-bound serine protease (ClpP class)
MTKCCGFWIWSLLALLCACSEPVSRVDTGQGTPPTAVEPSVLVVTLQGKLGTQELARCHRTLREAESHGLRWVVFRLDWSGSPGEDDSEVQSLLDRMQQTQVGTIALLRGRVTHSAAYVALCCDRAYCMPGAAWGEVTKPEPDWTELWSSSPDEAMARRLDALTKAAAARLDARKNKLRPDARKLALAMVDPRVQLIEATVREGGVERVRILDSTELTALQSAGSRINAENALTRPLVLDAAKIEEHGLSSGTLQGLDQLAEVLAIDRNTIGELQPNWAERMVGWLELLQPFLLVAGFVLILFEVKTPGFGLPGVLGVAFLGLAMFYSYLVGLAEITEILVFFLGLAAIGVEIFLLPGTVIFGGVGFLCLLLSLVLSQQSFVLPSNELEEELLLANLRNLTVLVLMVLALGWLTWRLLPNIPWANRLFLPPPERSPQTGGGTESGLGLDDAFLTALVGRSGLAATVLRPAGIMEIDGERIDVVTEGEFVEAGTPLKVLYVQGSRVVVAVATEPKRSGERGSVGVVLLLAIVGLALLVAEVFFVSLGIIAVCSGVSLITAVFFAFQESTSFGFTMLVAESIAAPIVLALAFKLLPRTRLGQELILTAPASPGSAADPSLVHLLHKTGVTLSPLRPAGFARIDGHKVDVVTRGEMIDADCSIKVLEVTQNRVVVGRS